MFKQKTAYEMRISDWSSDVCSSDLLVDTGYFPFPASRGFDCPGYFHHIVIVEIQTRNRITGFGISRFFFNGKNTSIIGEFDYPKPLRILDLIAEHRRDRKSTRLNPVTTAHIVCRILLQKKKKT